MTLVDFRFTPRHTITPTSFLETKATPKSRFWKGPRAVTPIMLYFRQQLLEVDSEG